MAVPTNSKLRECAWCGRRYVKVHNFIKHKMLKHPMFKQMVLIRSSKNKLDRLRHLKILAELTSTENIVDDIMSKR